MHRARAFVAAATVVIVASATGCGDSTPTTPTTDTPTTFTEVFSGTITPNGAASHTFVSQSSGEARATLTALTPDTSGTVGILLGTWVNSSCTFVVGNDKATLGATVRGLVGGAGELCARIYDVGAVSSPITYELTVVHP